MQFQYVAAKAQSRAVTQTNKTAVGGEKTPNHYQQFHGLFSCVASLAVMQVFLISRGIAVSQFCHRLSLQSFTEHLMSHVFIIARDSHPQHLKS